MVYYLLSEPFSAISGLALSSVVANLMRQNHHSVVVCPRADGTWGFASNRILEIRKASVLTLNLKGQMRGWSRLPASVRRPMICHILEPFLNRLRPGDYVFCQNWPYVAQALQSRIHSAGAKLVYHAHNSVEPYAGRGLFESTDFDAMIFNSEAMREDAMALMPYLTNTHVIYNGADDSCFYPPDSRPLETLPPLVLFVGRLVPAKGVHILVEAIRLLNQWKVAVRCKIVGSCHTGSHDSKKTAYIRSLQTSAQSNITFSGFRAAPSLGEEYRAADIFCCPSIWREPFGNVNVEAMACGLPVVATRVGGIPEIASEGGVAMVEPDSAVALAEALRPLIINGTARRQMGSEALTAFRRRFTWANIAIQHEALIESLNRGTSSHHALRAPQA